MLVYYFTIYRKAIGNWKVKKKKILDALPMAMLATLIVGLIIDSLFIYETVETQESVMIYSEPIIALNSTTTLDGTSGIFYVSITEDDYYQVMKEVEDGGYKKESFPIENTTLYMTEDNFRVETYVEQETVTTYTDESEARFFKPFWKSEEEMKKVESDVESERSVQESAYYKIYIPEGSMVEEYAPM